MLKIIPSENIVIGVEPAERMAYLCRRMSGQLDANDEDENVKKQSHGKRRTNTDGR